MDKLVIKKIWQDEVEDFFEFELYCFSKFLNVTTNCYTYGNEIKSLKNDILKFLNEENFKNKISFGFDTLCENNIMFKMEMIMKRTGHILCDVLLTLNDDSNFKHKCSFYLETEFYLLEKFANSVEYLINAEIGTEISLLGED